MFPSDPRFEFDNYNDATKYRTTGELMEVSFQPLFIEGQPDGSSRRIICDRHNYPAHTEKLGIGVSSTNGVSSLTGAGPATNAWAAYLQQKRKRRENDEDDKYMPNNRYRARARFGVGGGGAIMGAGMQDANGVYQQDYIHPIQNAGGVVQPTTMAQSYNTPEIIPAVQQAGAGVGGAGVGAAAVGNDEADPPPAAGSESVGERLKAALASVGSSSPPSQGGGVGTKKGGGGDTGKAAGKRGGKTASAASGNMGLSGSYISNSGVSSDTTGSVRASLLSGTTPPEQEH